MAKKYKIASDPTWNRLNGPRVRFADTHGGATPKIGDEVIFVRDLGDRYGDDVEVTGLRSGWRISRSCLAEVTSTEPTPEPRELLDANAVRDLLSILSFGEERIEAFIRATTAQPE